MSKTDDNMQQVREVLNSDLQLSMRMVQDHVRIDKITMHAIIIEILIALSFNNAEDLRQTRSEDLEGWLKSEASSVYLQRRSANHSRISQLSSQCLYWKQKLDFRIRPGNKALKFKNGILQHRLVKKMLEWANSEWKQCSLFSLTSR